MFISSTICDFRDFRSALKFWLEEMGCDVLMSEFNDFDREPLEGTFESCFNAIDKCDFYVLLVGRRKGTVMENGVSVTQAEYRHAAALARKGRIKPVVFVRSEIEAALRERQAVQSDSKATSSYMDDPEFTSLFLKEIRRTELGGEESGSATGTMWCYPFDSFDDVVQALRVNLQIHRSVRRHALFANLQWELQHNVAELAMKRGISREVAWKSETIQPLMANYPTPNPDFGREFQIPRQEAGDLMMFLISLPDLGALQSRLLGESISSGEFLEYDPSKGRPVPTELYRALQNLNSAVDRYRNLRAATQDPTNVIGGEVTKVLAQGFAHESTITIKSDVMAWLYQLRNVMIDISVISQAVLRHIVSRSEFQMPGLQPTTSFTEQAGMIQAESVDPDEVLGWFQQ